MAAEPLSNAEIADRLASLAQLMASRRDHPYKVRAYRRAAASLRGLGESLDELVREGGDLTQFPGVGEGIASAIREIVATGSLGKLERLRGEADPLTASLAEYPRLDPARVRRILRRLGGDSVEALRALLDRGAIEQAFGVRMAQHVRRGLDGQRALLLYRADDLAAAVAGYLRERCGVRRAEIAGDVRRRVATVDALVFVIETDDFPGVIACLERYGGRTPLVDARGDGATFALAAGIPLRLRLASAEVWGLEWIAATGSGRHLRRLTAVTGRLRGRPAHGPLEAGAAPPRPFSTEAAVYAAFGLSFIPPELREGTDEIERAARGELPRLVTVADLRGELHAHTTASDGAHSIEQMAAAGAERGYAYLGITDHSASLKIAGGLSVDDLRAQVDRIDRLNDRGLGIRVLKSAEVDILADGSLDYPDELLARLDYTLCSIHSRFALDRDAQTERLLRAMDHPAFRILGHATGRLLLERPGYALDFDRVIERARVNRLAFEINSSPNRLDVSAEHARQAAAVGVPIAITTDAHSTRELDLVRCGIDQARRAGLEPRHVLNCRSWPELEAWFHRERGPG